jgi:group I intron endonuclease
MMISGIYKILNKINGKFYIGSSINIKTRWSKHKSLLRNNKHDNEHLQNAWNIYGEDNFEFIILYETEQCLLLQEEENIIKNLNCCDRQIGYNKTENTLCPMRGRKLSEETICKLRAASTGKKHTEETKHKISRSNKNKIVSEETRRKMSDAKKGKEILHKEKLDNSRKTKQFREKISKFAKTRTGIKNPNSRLNLQQIEVIIQDLEQNVLKIQEIANKFNVSRSTIKRIKYKQTYVD